MKYVLYSSLLLACISCNNATKQANADSLKGTTPSASNITQQPPVLSEKERLIQALEKLQKDFASKDKDAIAAYFQFPVESDALQVFNVNASFDKQVVQSNYRISRSLFLTHFNALYDNLEMSGFNDVFSHLQLNKLKDTTAIQKEVSKANDVCAHSYSITIEGNEVTLQYGVYTNEAYTGKHQKNDPEECAEYAAFWFFDFDGEKLIFNRHQVAG